VFAFEIITDESDIFGRLFEESDGGTGIMMQTEHVLNNECKTFLVTGGKSKLLVKLPCRLDSVEFEMMCQLDTSDLFCDEFGPFTPADGPEKAENNSEPCKDFLIGTVTDGRTDCRRSDRSSPGPRAGF
jgi:hypothetical protein